MSDRNSEYAGPPCSAPDLPTGYKQRMDKEVLTIMPAAQRVMEICREFCNDSVEITDGDITVRLAQNARPHAEARSDDSVQADVRCFDCQKPTDISNRYQHVIKTGRVVNSVFEKIIVSPLCKDCFDKRNAPNAASDKFPITPRTPY